MGMTLQKYLAVFFVAFGLTIFFIGFFLFSSNPSIYLNGIIYGVAFFLSGVIFWFAKFQEDRRYCAVCGLMFGASALIAGLVLFFFWDPFLAISGLFVGVVALIVGGLFWFFEPKGRTWIPPSPCFIATASYGSPYADEVQFLRRIRDTQITRTRLGAIFVEKFEAVYYSFSPQIAFAMYRNLHLATFMQKVIVAPLIKALSLIFNQ